jgi:peroxiredoxin
MLAALGMALPGIACPAAAANTDPQPLEIGAAAPDFDLPGVDDKRHKLAEFAATKVLAVVFTCNHCPTAQAYEERLKKLHADYREKDAALVAISPNDPLAVRLDELGYTDLGDSLEEMKLRAKDRGFAFPYLYDGETQAVSRAYGVQATPHIFIFDAGRKLRYAGRIDDEEVKTPRSHEARNAIEALLAGKPVPIEKTKVFGCSTKWAEKREDAKRAVAKWNQEAVDVRPIDAAAVKALRKNETRKLRLVNVWATWCGPCVAEMPELTTIHRMYRGRDFELVTISMDDPEKRDKALEALKKEHLSAANHLYSGGSRDDLVQALDPDWEGPIPHTVLIAPGGKIVYRKTGAFDPRELKKAIADAVGRTY